ncbi:MAG: lipocalin-like domain-containing protein [Candidatus Binatia bacterium]
MSSPLIPQAVFPISGLGKPVLPVELPRDERLRDHMVEWWYFVGHLKDTSSSDRFAIEMTAARLSLSPLRAIETCYIAVIDHANKGYLSADRQSLSAYDHEQDHLKLVFEPPLGQPDPWRIEGWTAPIRYELDGGFRVRATPKAVWEQRAVRLRFEEADQRPPLLHGKKRIGIVSFFGLEMGYYSRTRLKLEGALKLNARHLLVDGAGWMDHEWGTGDLLSNRWTFIAVQLDSGEDLCVYRVDKRVAKQGGPTFGYVVDATEARYTNKAKITSDGTVWGPGNYPLRNRIELDFGLGKRFDLWVEPEFEDQRRVPTGERALPYVTFWEGAAKVLDQLGNQVGRAFLELAGYQ